MGERRRLWVVLAGLLVTMFLSALDQTIVYTSIRTIADRLGGLDQQAWATTAYLVTATPTTPLYGRLSDLYGRRPLFLTAIILFLLGSVGAAGAMSMGQLAGWRAAQGLGAGGLIPLGMATLADLVDPRTRARYQSYLVAWFTSANVVGPLVGGFLAGRPEVLGIAGWRWVFLVNLPVGLLATVVIAAALDRRPAGGAPVRVDWPGALALTFGLVPLLLVATEGRAWGWTSAASLGCTVASAVGIALFVELERRAGRHALLPLASFRVPAFGIGAGAVLVLGAGVFGGLAAVPLYLQIVRGASPTVAGLSSVPMLVGVMAASSVSGRAIGRNGRLKVWPLCGTAVMALGLVLLSGLTMATPLWWMALCMGLFGAGLGMSTQPLMLMMQNALPASEIGMTTSAATFFRQIGATLGTSALLSVLFAAVPAGVPTTDTSFIERLDPRAAAPFRLAYLGATGRTFLCGAGLLVAAWLLVAALPRATLRESAPRAARLDQEVD